MLDSRRFLVVRALALAAGLSLAAVPPVASAAPVRSSGPADCPPDWLGTTTNAQPQVSDDGRFVVFTMFEPGNAGGGGLIVLRDLRRGRTTVVSDPAPDSWGNVNLLPSISGDGRRISYLRLARDVYDNNAQIWVYDRRTRARTLEGIGHVWVRPELSTSGRYLTFAREIAGTLGRQDVYRRDVDRDITTLVSADLAGGPADRSATDPEISANGRFVLFHSFATDLTPASGGTRDDSPLFVRDVRTRRTTVVPRRGGEATAVHRRAQHLSADGRFVVYTDPAGVWRYDRRTGRTVTASRPTRPDYDAVSGAVGARGRRVLLSAQPGLAVRDVRTGRQTAVDVRPDGTPDPADIAYLGAMTPDARHVVFYTGTVNLDPRDTAAAGSVAVYVRDLRRATTRLVSTTRAGGRCEGR